MGFYKNRRAYLVAAIQGQRRILESERAHEGVKAQSKSIFLRHCAELDDLDAAEAEKPREGVIA